MINLINISNIPVNTYLLVAIIVILFVLIGLYKSDELRNRELDKGIEGFVGTKIIPTGDLYDKFYAGIYDTLFNDEAKSKYEVLELTDQIRAKDSAKILDLGCGTGDHVKMLKDEGYNVTGLDKSNAMLQKAKEKSPNARLVIGDMESDDTFPIESFTHITCYYFTIYYAKNLDKFISNVYYWLQEGGIFAVHIVNKDKFDPILDASSPFPGFSVQKYSKKRVTKSTVHFNNFVYNAEFKINKSGKAYFNETFEFKHKPQIRKQQHDFNMFKIKTFLRKMKDNNFEMIGKTDLLSSGFPFQYVFYFKKMVN
jgi:ubiquinone/menaquinone biosynthesis C-methylase UbiE